MTVPRIAINGFGRIGRTVLRIAKMRRHFNVVAVNDLSGPEQLAYSFRYDSVHGVYPGRVSIEGNTMLVDNDSFRVLGEKDPAKLPWRELDVDYVIESTGKFRKLDDLKAHGFRGTLSLFPPHEGRCDSAGSSRAEHKLALQPGRMRHLEQ